MPNLMIISWRFLFISLLLLFFHLILRRRLFRPQTIKNLPPGPPRLPILGNLLDLGKKPHKSLAAIAKVHGPLISLQLGWRTTIVISSPSVAQEMFQKNDAVLAERNLPLSTTILDHHLASLVFLPPGPRWRYLRRVCTAHIFAPSRIDATQQLRSEKISQLLTYARKCSETTTAVNVGQAMFTTSLNILSSTIFSVDLASLTSSDSIAHELKELVSSLLEVGGEVNISDFFPVFKPIDPQGCYRRSKVLTTKLIKMFDELIQQRLMKLKEEDSHIREKDVLDTLLRINQEKEGGNEPINIPHLMFDLFIAGTDTTSSTVEWAMTELLGKPEKMKKVQVELDEVIGPTNPITETNIAKLTYLHAVIKETLRLHPPAPFLIPRNAAMDVELCGYMIPKDAQVLVNVWAIGRDENVWKDPTCFLPERFLGSSMDVKGHNYDLLPFGSGRRVCVGITMALRILPLALGSLIHSFDWEVEKGGALDMDDKFGITLQKVEPLCVIPSSR